MDEFHANVRAASVLHYILVVKYLNNHAGVRCRASDSHRKSNDLRYLVHLPPKTRFNPGNKQTDRTYREACRKADLFPPRWPRLIFQVTDLTVLRGLAHSGNVLALKWLSPNIDPPVPWQRVIASSGTISSRGPGTDGAQRQRDALEAEGVEVTDGRTGEMRVDLRAYGWFPNALEGQDGDEDDADV